MRPIRLEMTAFGPFAQPQCIDFSQLGQNPLFLINGATGSGKSTILDAICFALYGKTTGAEREAAEMRCDHAAEDQLCEVSFTFALDQQHYRIRRVPEQSRPKARGEGYTIQAAEAQLWRLNAQAEQLLVPRKVNDATQMITELTGLSADQFRQVMVLPQGQFRQLLMADSKSREQIFSQLFQTQIYRRLEERLKSEAAAIRRQVEAAQQQAAGVLESVELSELGELSQMLEQAEQALQPAQAARQQCQQQLDQARAELQAAERLAERFALCDQQRAQLSSLEQQQPQMIQRQQQLVLIQRALGIAPYQQQHEQQQQRLQQQQATYQAQCRASERAQVAERNARTAQQQLPEFQRLRDGAAEQRAQLQQYQARAARLPELQSAQQQAADQLGVCHRALQQAEAELERYSQQQRDTQQRLHGLQQAVVEGTQIDSERTQLQVTLTQAQELAELQQQASASTATLTQLKQRGQQLAAQEQQQRTALQQLELRWHLGQAALLAQQLQPAQACPVCGSTEHPQPAHAEQPAPTEEALARAREQLSELNAQLNQAREQYRAEQSQRQQLGERIERLSARLGNWAERALEEIDAALAATEARWQQWQQQQQQLSQLQAAQVSAEAALDAAQAQVQTQQLQLQQQRDAELRAQSELLHLQQELPEPYRQAGALESALNEVETQLEQWQQQIDALNHQVETCVSARASAEAAQASAAAQLAQQQDAAESALQRWQEKLAEAGFADVKDYLHYVEQGPQVSELEQQQHNYQRQLEQCRGAVTQLEAELNGKQPPDLEAQRSAVSESELRWQQADSDWQLAQSHHARYLQARRTLDKLLQQSEALEQQYAVVGTLSEVANGQTGDKVSLQRFVLSVLLDDVLVEASHRLHLMSKGRYRLLRKEERAKRNRASGLELEVEDAYTGKNRSVATLSGGESFMAALALALGVSDVVQAHAGGIRLDTLFIDEGFGSLDPESLELAIRTLVDLQSSGRMVGVISHVGDLKEQLDQRIDVVSHQGGSDIRMVLR